MLDAQVARRNLDSTDQLNNHHLGRVLRRQSPSPPQSHKDPRDCTNDEEPTSSLFAIT